MSDDGDEMTQDGLQQYNMKRPCYGVRLNTVCAQVLVTFCLYTTMLPITTMPHITQSATCDSCANPCLASSQRSSTSRYFVNSWNLVLYWALRILPHTHVPSMLVYFPWPLSRGTINLALAFCASLTARAVLQVCMGSKSVTNLSTDPRWLII